MPLSLLKPLLNMLPERLRLQWELSGVSTPIAIAAGCNDIGGTISSAILPGNQVFRRTLQRFRPARCETMLA